MRCFSQQSTSKNILLLKTTPYISISGSNHICILSACSRTRHIALITVDAVAPFLTAVLFRGWLALIPGAWVPCMLAETDGGPGVSRSPLPLFHDLALKIEAPSRTDALCCPPGLLQLRFTLLDPRVTRDRLQNHESFVTTENKCQRI